MVNLILGNNADSKKTIFQVTCTATSAIAVFFAYLNLHLGLTKYAIAEFIAAVLWMYLCLKSFKATELALKRFSIVYLISFYALVLAGIIIAEFDSGLFSWIFLLPVISYLLLGEKKGFIVTFVFVFSSIMAISWKVTQQAQGPWIVIANASLSVSIIWLISHMYEAKRVLVMGNLEDIASKDPLTGMYNRLLLKAIFSKVTSEAPTKDQKLYLMIIDVDHFKRINDLKGHDYGDQVLIKIAETITSQLREQHWAFRIGGEEFSILMEGRNREEGIECADKIRLAITRELKEFTDSDIPIVTVSIGLSEYGSDGFSLSSVLKAADQRLYKAKNYGRNRVVFD